MAISIEYLLWLLPILVAVSLVMAATRHERNEKILAQAWQTGLWTLSFLGAIAATLWFAMFWIG
ncbi:MAG: hypothetical protein NTY15_07290 [Planctomycetota bacterium]|jgi:hypothetical protein|nr:hypothetical protein [Planctomycetota bacterium]